MNDCPIGRGNRTGYDYGCKCDPCRAANAASSATKRVRGSHPGGRPTTPDVDPIAVERCLQGTYDIRGLNAEERRQVVALGKRRGLNHLEIARRTGFSDRSVQRIAAKLRSAA